MKNKEKFAKEIFDIACSGYSVGVDKNTGMPQACEGKLNCVDCLFSTYKSCSSGCKDWCESEEKRVLQFSFDIIANSDTDCAAFIDDVVDLLKSLRNIDVVGGDFSQDVTELYKSEYPDLVEGKVK